MRSLYRTCAIGAAIYLVISAAVAAAYFLHFRPGWMTPEVLVHTPALLTNPSSPPEKVREIALKGHQVILANFAALDAAIIFMLIVSLGAAATLIYVAARARAATKNDDSAL